MYVLSFYTISETQAALRFPAVWRIIYFGISLLFISVSLVEQSIIWPALAAAAVTAVSGLYQESWVFDLMEATIVSSVGIMPLVKKTNWDMGNLTAIKVHTPRQLLHKELSRQAWNAGQERLGNFFSRRTIRLELIMNDERRVLVYTEQSRKADRIQTLAASLASWLEVPLLHDQD